MLIYNYKKEFLGIDESDLKVLGLSNLADLRAESADFADLFVKTPGFIHNFQHVHWIDYILCNDSGIESKAIINIKGKNYATSIDIQTIFLIDNPSQKAYIVNLSDIRALSHAQNEKISGDIIKKVAPKTISGATEIVTAPSQTIIEGSKCEVSFDPYERVDESPIPNIVDDIYEETIPEPDLDLDVPLDIEIEEDALEDIEHMEEVDDVLQTDELTNRAEAETEVNDDIVEDGPFAEYIYDPKVASEDLGLPIDLVEEFIQDFIAQANSFKNELYESAKSGNMDNLKIQSHKLKGVAANLRVEDALDALTIINSSENDFEIKENLDRLYRIIHRLSNKKISVAEPIVDKDDFEDDFVLSLKDVENDVAEELNSQEPEVEELVQKVNKPAIEELDLAQDIIDVDDSQVPDSIDILELEDDEFLKPEIDVQEAEIDDEDLSILDNPIDMTQESIQEEALDIAIIYDKELVASDIGLDIDSFNELFEDYLEEAKELSNSIISSIEKDDLNACKSAAIKLKGMSENMRIHKLDDDLEAIINSTDSTTLKGFIDDIISKLEILSNTEEK